MNTRKALVRGLAASTAVASVLLLAPLSATAQTFPANYDPAHHSTDVNDPDPAHHRPVLVFSASTGEYVLTPVAGFDLYGYKLGSNGGGANGQPPYPEGYSTDPAHHSTDVNDPDPAHHRPYFVYDKSTSQWRLVPIPGFDLNGNRATSSTFS